MILQRVAWSERAWEMKITGSISFWTCMSTPPIAFVLASVWRIKGSSSLQTSRIWSRSTATHSLSHRLLSWHGTRTKFWSAISATLRRRCGLLSVKWLVDEQAGKPSTLKMKGGSFLPRIAPSVESVNTEPSSCVLPNLGLTANSERHRVYLWKFKFFSFFVWPMKSVIRV